MVLRSPRLLIIDDDVEVAGALQEYFMNIHYSVEVRLNGEDALRQFQRDTPEVVLLDLAILGTDSVQVLQRMRAAHPEVPVIIVTANDTDIALARQTLTMGAFDYVTKPIDFDHLERVVRVALAHHDMTGPTISEDIFETMARSMSLECTDCGCWERREGCACGCHAQFCDCHGAPIARCRRARGPRLLIIDDDVEVAGALHEYFTNIHYSVEVRLNGEDALRQFQRDTPEVVLLDLAIPATDSVQVLQRMRAAHPKVLVIIVTANDTDIALARQTLTMGAFDYVTKPIDFDHLERVVRVALAHHDRLMTGPAGRRMELPTRLTVHNSWYALDGGTIVLQAINEAGQEHRVTLVQHALPQPSPWLREIPGRLYFDGDLIPIRSDLEARVLALLRTAEVTTSGPVTAHGESIQLSPNAVLGADIRQVLTRGPEENIRALLADVIRFVESDEYLRFAERVEQAADSTRYTVWVACDPSSRNQVAVRLGRVLGIGLRAVLELLDRGAPVAKDVTAVEVSELTEQCGVEGLRLRIDPPYRWRLASRL